MSWARLVLCCFLLTAWHITTKRSSSDAQRSAAATALTTTTMTTRRTTWNGAPQQNCRVHVTVEDGVYWTNRDMETASLPPRNAPFVSAAEANILSEDVGWTTLKASFLCGRLDTRDFCDLLNRLSKVHTKVGRKNKRNVWIWQISLLLILFVTFTRVLVLVEIILTESLLIGVCMNVMKCENASLLFFYIKLFSWFHMSSCSIVHHHHDVSRR